MKNEELQKKFEQSIAEKIGLDIEVIRNMPLDELRKHCETKTGKSIFSQQCLNETISHEEIEKQLDECLDKLK